MSVQQIYDSSDSDTSPLSTDEYDDDDDSDLMDMAVSVKPRQGTSNNVSPSKASLATTASSSSTNVKPLTKSGGAHKRTAPRYKKKIQTQPQRLNAICKKRSLKWFKNGMKRATMRLCLKEFYLNRIEKNGVNIIVASLNSSAAAAAAGENKVKSDSKHLLQEEMRYNPQLFIQQHQRALIENFQEQKQNKMALKEQEQERLLMEILKQERLQAKSPELICLDVTEDEESPQKEEPSPRVSPVNKVDKIPPNKNLMQMKIVDIKSAVDDVVICPDEDDIVEVKTQINYERTPNVETRNIYEQPISSINYRSQANLSEPCNELKIVSAAEAVNINNDKSQFLVSASNVNIPGIMEVDPEVVADIHPIVIQNDIIPMRMPMKPCVVAEPTPIMIEVLPKEEEEQLQMSFKLTSTPSFGNSAAILPHPPQVVTPMAHIPSPIRAPQTTATPQAAHMRLPAVVPSTHATSVVTSSTPITTSITLPPPQVHASNMSVKRRRSTTPENNKIPPATTVQLDTSKQGEESSDLPGDTDGDERPAKKLMLDPSSNAAFYQRIIDLIPEYEEALSTHLERPTETEEKLDEAIKRTTSDLVVLEDELKYKEEEWNKLLYLKRVQQELLERMLRVRGVIKAKKRAEMVPKYSLKQLQELEECLKIRPSSPQLASPQQTTEREKPETEREPPASVNKIAQMINRLADMLPEDIQAHAEKLNALKEQFLVNDKPHERWNNSNEATTSRLIAENIAKLEERIKRQREEEEMRRKYMESKIEEEQRRLRYENQLRYEKQRELEYLQQLEDSFRKYTDGMPEEKLKMEAELKLRQQAQLQPPPPTMGGRQNSFKNVNSIIDNFRRENPQSLPPPPLFKCNKPAKPETYVLNNNNYSNNNYKASSSSMCTHDIPTLKTLLSASGNAGGSGSGDGASGSSTGFGQPRSTREQCEHSGSGMAQMPNPYRPKYDMRFNNASYDENLRASTSSSSNPYKNTHRHSFDDVEYNRNNYGISNGGVQLPDLDNGICQECYKCEAQYVCCNCNKARYCSKKCQLIAWDKHQDECGE